MTPRLFRRFETSSDPTGAFVVVSFLEIRLGGGSLAPGTPGTRSQQVTDVALSVDHAAQAGSPRNVAAPLKYSEKISLGLRLVRSKYGENTKELLILDFSSIIQQQKCYNQVVGLVLFCVYWQNPNSEQGFVSN